MSRGGAGGADPAPAGWRTVLVLGLIGAALGLGWGIADQPRYRATATVAVESDSQGSDRARLERFAQRGMSDEVATKAAAVLGGDVPGADLLADVDVRPAAEGGFVIVAATADAPDVAAAAANGFQRALVDVEGDPLALGEAASIPAAPDENRSGALWAGIGFGAGVLAGLLVVAASRRSRRHRHDDRQPPAPRGEPAGRPASAAADPLVAFAGRVGAVVAALHPGSGGIVDRDGDDAVAIAPRVADDAELLVDRLGVGASSGPRSLAVAAIGRGDAAGLGTALAVVAANAGRRVLLVDADLAGSPLAERLGVDPCPGLHDYLEGRAAPRQVLHDVSTARTGFGCVPAGAGGSEAGVSGPRFAVLADRLQRVYDVVVYVAPPILGGAAAVAAAADATVVLADPDARTDELERATEVLANARVRAIVTASH